jgi:hypothetical protein
MKPMKLMKKKLYIVKPLPALHGKIYLTLWRENKMKIENGKLEISQSSIDNR